MPGKELETIAASMQDALHRAYALGRSDALRRVVEMVQADELGSKTVALLSHSEPSASEALHPEAPPIAMPHADAPHVDAETEASEPPGDAAHNDNAERADAAERAGAAGPEARTPSPPASVKDFLLDYLYPLGAKK